MKAAKLAWLGSDVPLFKGNLANLQKLDKLVEQSSRTLAALNILEKEICLHIISTLAERRRHIKKGFDYDKVQLQVHSENNTLWQFMLF